MKSKIKGIIPGLLICIVIAIISEGLGSKFSTIGAATFAIFIGIIAGNTIFSSKIYDEGTKFSEKDLLNYSIVLMGASLNIMEIINLGGNGVLFIVSQMALTIFITYMIGMKLGFNKKFSLLMSAGNAVCGSSAIGATAPVIDSNESDKGISITIVNVTGTILMILLPLITAALYNNSTLESSAMMGGILQSVGQVIGSAKFIGDDVVKLATVFKIIRIILLVVVVIGFSKFTSKDNEEVKELEEEMIDVAEEVAIDEAYKKKEDKKSKLKVSIPWFITGFFVVCIVNSLGLLPEVATKIFKWISSNFEIIALAGIGMRVKIKDLIKEGPKAMAYGLSVGACQIVFAVVLIKIFF
ncbi:MAG: YeiH family protein [Clostridium sp.]